MTMTTILVFQALALLGALHFTFILLEQLVFEGIRAAVTGKGHIPGMQTLVPCFFWCVFYVLLSLT